MDQLKKALKLNSIFSSVSGIVFILLNKQIANLFGVENNTVFWITGLILIYFSLTIWFEISRQRKIAVLWIIIQDYLWVLGSFILILLNPFNITLLGNIITGVIALIVLFMGINQTIAINKIKK